MIARFLQRDLRRALKVFANNVWVRALFRRIYAELSAVHAKQNPRRWLRGFRCSRFAALRRVPGRRPEVCHAAPAVSLIHSASLALVIAPVFIERSLPS